MLVGEILERYPDSAQIMEDFGLHCTSCSVNMFEPLREGALSHGMAEEMADDLIERLNEMAVAQHQAPVDGIHVSAKAAKKIQEYSEMEEKNGWALRVTAKDNEGMEPAYGMDFVEKASPEDKSFEFFGVTVVIGPESMENMKGAQIDYLETTFGSGFKITNPKFNKKGGCCGGSGEGCGCSSGGKKGGCGC